MKGQIVSLLKKRCPEYVSGEEISQILGVSRTAIWKHIKKLKEDGYRIESHSRIGYRLVHVPDRLFTHELEGLLTGKLIGSYIVYRETVNSTNDLAKELAREGAESGTVVIAEEQTGGKGRMGRKWHSPEGEGLWFSVILRPPISPSEAPKITLVAAVALAKAIRELNGIEAGIKWPNDILISGRKLAGILTEMSAEIDRVNYVIVGIGVNVNLDSEKLAEGLSETATFIEKESCGQVSRLRLLSGILDRFDVLYEEFINGHFSSILSLWKEMSVTINRWVRVTSIAGVDEGIAFDIDAEGALLLMKKDGSMKRVLSGDVTLR
ncbi:biotin--[acetyl-CoA-carboxylase] ligase [Phosphitispora fastidiosa]|uniref:biotin--[acetyl-CoA-carboxylase] ligase n=1 Tax=Phosphitispora fastidiosa TaxID=2837202 RepID=UPI001E41A103|nr:biotin--[acetyl-CoA-carboxylase] ligase [Phosphitispora fastidiosa]MBU7007832.1 BirA family biotin operon repressor/biotin-[acetyl-CoA-carboxylase] ligase [Phosphitispora fastidiosa]